MEPRAADVVVVGAGHNGLVAATMLARAGLRVTVLEASDAVGGACRTERPFRLAPDLGQSTGAYLLGPMPPELMRTLRLELPLIRRDPHYFLPTADGRHLLLGSDGEAAERALRTFFSDRDALAVRALEEELAALREDLAPALLMEPAPLEETAERYIRPALRGAFVDLCQGSVAAYLERFGFHSELLTAMYLVTDGLTGLSGGPDAPGSGHNFLVHNLCRLPGSDGTWMLVRGGMGTVTSRLADLARSAGAAILTEARVEHLLLARGAVTGVALADGRELRSRIVLGACDPFRLAALAGEALPRELRSRLELLRRDGSSLKVNLALRGLPRFTCLPEGLPGPFGATMHLLPQERPLAALREMWRTVREGRLPDRPALEWYVHTTLDPTLRDGRGRHSSALFVQSVPYQPAGSSWDCELPGYVDRLIGICDEFAPGTSDLVEDTFALPPPAIEAHFGITGGHIFHVDNSFSFTDRVPYRIGLPGLYAGGAGCHPAGSVIGAAGHNAARRIIADMRLVG
ncbi:MAG TPA: NAD(P)/FAD-dependent oxidoreductase [Candidatus Dormibacteraeota bacterium]|nr:NAD(P)/FAD-dependent oxidoreductase [Candidatus Dormibacteraeota bacterium]